MILAGDIGGTNARLAYFQPQNGSLQLISERDLPQPRIRRPGRDCRQIFKRFRAHPEIACFRHRGAGAQWTRRNFQPSLDLSNRRGLHNKSVSRHSLDQRSGSQRLGYWRTQFQRSSPL
jgi:hypothetical protein